MFELPPPKDWETFEELCADLWSEILKDKNIQRNGRRGQAQNGVDIYGVDDETGERYGIQCKHKTFYKKLDISEIDSEIKKAESFRPRLDKYIIATSASKDVRIENHVRQLNVQNFTNGKFSIYVYGWEDILEKIYNYRNILKKYYNFLINPSSPDEIYFNFWYRNASIDKLWYYGCYLPFHTYDLQYSYYFIEILNSYLNKHDDFISSTLAVNSNSLLKEYISKFNVAAQNLLYALHEYEPKKETSTNSDDIILIYWVEYGHLEYHERSDFVESKKDNIRSCFYHLIEVANKIITIWNTRLGNGKNINLIEFAQPNPDFGLIRGLYLIKPHYPILKN
ncbi:restriction endonuclease [Nitratifractor salsuginis]|uniref:Restriction endonuclease type IV Mrr domain-containing protein n=1 Tax=Nitratifractor salsuginis (strain DSM 16511 / JCM 12458 / E9I37-1) TaxID=749222 RepID=E6X245_NITSE|nr:restriction endonuclease [Nitratifractor salsuginis]ADV47114.1 hypothetical protein Nitsa_1870 [Nitratifractor salsuginis DSM 16511]